MNLHQLRNRVFWNEPHVYYLGHEANRCSECGDVDVPFSGSHLTDVHNVNPTWVCECTDAPGHGMGRDEWWGLCNTTMGSVDANINPDGVTRTDLLDWTYPYKFVCPECRDHDHGRRRINRA